MAKQTVNIGVSANDGTGDAIRDAFDKVNDNINEIYQAFGDGSALSATLNEDGNFDLTNNLNVGGNAVITGNLTVNGTTTTVSSETVTFEDNILLINKADDNGDGYSSVSSGIEIDTTGTNPSFIHTFSDSTWTLSDNLAVSGTLNITGETTFTDDILVSGNIRNATSGGANDYIDIDDGSIKFYADGKKMEWLSSGSFNVWETDGGNKAFSVATSGTKSTVSLFDNGTRTVLFDPNGNSYFNGGSVGIGTTTPRTKLHVTGLTGDDDPSLGASVAPFFVSNTANSYGLNIGVNNQGDAWLQAQSNTSSTAYDILLNPLGGNLGVGTSSPSENLTIAGTGQVRQKIISTDNQGARFDLQSSGGSRYSLQALSNGDFMMFDEQNGHTAQRYFDGASGAWAFYTVGSERMRISASGNVGIGTTSPANNVHIKGDADGEGLTIQRASSTSGAYADLMFSVSTSEAATPNAKIRATRGTDYADTDISIITNSAERMRIDSSGNVGIGTDSPDAKLDIRSDASYGLYTPAEPQLNIVNTNTEGTAGFLALSAYYNNTGETYYRAGGIGGGKETSSGDQQWGGYLSFFTTSDGTAGAASGLFEHMRITADGNVGIGTTSPNRSLHVIGQVAIDDSTTPTGGLLVSPDGTSNKVYSRIANDNNTAHPLDFISGGSTSMRIDSSGNVGIGTTSPESLLHIESTVDTSSPIFTVENDNDIKLKIGSVRSAAGTNPDTTFIAYDSDLRFISGADSTNEVVRIDSSGKIKIGSTSEGFTIDPTASDVVTLSGIDTGGNGWNSIHLKADSEDGLFIEKDTNRVGIGSSSPVAKLEVNTGSNAAYFTRTAGDNGVLNPVVAISADSGNGILAASGSSMQFRVRAVGIANPLAGTTFMRITSSGAIEIEGQGTANTFIGDSNAGNLGTRTGTHSSGFGYNALGSLSSGNYNAAFGAYTLDGNTTGGANSAFGYNTLSNNTTGSDNVAVGSNALTSNTTSTKNVAVGAYSLQNNTAAALVAIGYKSLFANTTGTGNTAVGYNSAATMTTGSENTAIGNNALYYNATGERNTAIGFQSMMGVSGNSPQYNTAVGWKSMMDITTGLHNAVLGMSALENTTSGFSNVAVGNYTGQNLTTTANNVIIGYYAMQNAQGSNAYSNIAIGVRAARNLQGQSNVAIGYEALHDATTAINNTATGYQALLNLTTGDYNVGYGYSALSGLTTGERNTSIGYTAGNNTTSGVRNTFVGMYAGRVESDGTTAINPSRSVYIGYSTKSGVTDGTPHNETVIGYQAVGNGDNSFTFGDTNVTKHVFPSGDITVNGDVAIDRNSGSIAAGTYVDLFDFTGFEAGLYQLNVVRSGGSYAEHYIGIIGSSSGGTTVEVITTIKSSGFSIRQKSSDTSIIEVTNANARNFTATVTPLVLG